MFIDKQMEIIEQITCLNCGYQEYPLSSGPDNFVIEERKIEV